MLYDLKVFAGVYADGEEIPFVIALPFNLESLRNKNVQYVLLLLEI